MERQTKKIDNYELELYYALPEAIELLDWLRKSPKHQEHNPLPGLVRAHQTFWAASPTAAAHYGEMRAKELNAVHFNVNEVRR